MFDGLTDHREEARRQRELLNENKGDVDSAVMKLMALFIFAPIIGVIAFVRHIFNKNYVFLMLYSFVLFSLFNLFCPKEICTMQSIWTTYFFILGIDHQNKKNKIKKNLDNLKRGFLIIGLKDSLGYTPKVLHWEDNQMQIETSLPLSQIQNKQEELGKILNKKITEIIPSTENSNQVYISFTDNVLQTLYKWNQECTNYFLCKAHAESIAIGHNGSNLLVEVLGQIGGFYHALNGGATRQGKSCLQRIQILSLLLSSFTERKLSIKLYLFDFKAGMELRFLENYSCVPVSFRPEMASAILEYLYENMENRLSKYSETGVVNIEEYRKKFPDDIEHRHVVVIDEAVDLFTALQSYYKFMTQGLPRNSSKPLNYMEIQQSIARRGACTGTHLFYTTQYFLAELFPSALSVNLTARSVMRVPNKASSIAMVGADDCADLPPIPGRFIYTGRGDLRELQGIYIEKDDMASILQQHIPVQPIDPNFIAFLRKTGKSSLLEETLREQNRRQVLINSRRN